MRKESDTMGEVEIPKELYYGSQTQRSLTNFPIGNEKMPKEVIQALLLIKRSAALVNHKLGLLSKRKKDAIISAADEILTHDYTKHFPLKVWQTGSGTHTNMNVNEVISNVAICQLSGKIGSKYPIHPNDDVNMSQSSNDTFPSAMHIASSFLVKKKLLPSIKILRESFTEKKREFSSIIKVGRTHLMDAAPLSYGQEFSGYIAQLDDAIEAIEQALQKLLELPLGGTAVGTGLNAPKEFSPLVIQEIAKKSKLAFVPTKNFYSAISSRGAILQMSSSLKLLGSHLMKIANDIRWAGSGPRCGLNEMVLPANEPGSSIMPGKVNPTQCEALTQVVVQVYGNDAAIAFAASQGNFQLNVYMPVMIYNLIQSIHLLSDAMGSFTKNCLKKLSINTKIVKQHLDNSLMLATALNKKIGYDEASKIVKRAYEKNISLQQAAADLKILDKKTFEKIVDPKKMIKIR